MGKGRADRLNAIDTIDLPEGSLDRRPSIPLGHLANPSAFRAFCNVFAWFLEEIDA